MKQLTESQYGELCDHINGALRLVLDIVPNPVPKPPVLEPVGNVRGPLGLAYKSAVNVPHYARPGAVMVAGRCGTSCESPVMQSVREAGGEVLQYLIPNEVPDNGGACDRDREFYSGFGSPVPLWPWLEADGSRRSKWEKSKMIDFRVGTAWSLYVVEYVAKLMRAGQCDGVFLDTVGARTYAKTTNWDSWRKEEKDAYTAGHVNLVRRIDAMRKQINPGFIVVTNAHWDRRDGDQAGFEAEQHINGVCMEHPTLPDDPTAPNFHKNHLSRPFGNPEKRRVFVIANSQADAREWFKVPGITHVSGQHDDNGGYGNPLEPAV